MKQMILLFSVIILLPAFLKAQDIDSTLSNLISEAVSLSPKLSALQNKLEISKARIPQVSNLPDPTLTLGLMNIPTNSFSLNQEAMTGKVIGLSQQIPFPGKLSAMGNVSRKDEEITGQELIDARNEIIKNVSNAYYELGFIRKSIAIETESKKLLQSIADVVRTKYAVSSASQQNLIKVELEITNINDKLDELNNRENEQLSVLNSYLIRPADSPIRTYDDIRIKFLAISQTKLESLARQNRPFLKGIDLAGEKAALQKNLSEYDYYPNFNLGLQYTLRDKIAATNMNLHDLVSVVVGITLPLNYGGKVSSRVQEMESMQRFYEDQYKSSLQMLDANFGSSVSKLNTLKKRINLIDEGLFPQAQQNLKTTLASYQVGQIDFINVIDAENKLYTVETSLYRLKTDYLKEVALLEFLVGTKLR